MSTCVYDVQEWSGSRYSVMKKDPKPRREKSAYSIKQAAEYLEVSTRTIHNLIGRGLLRKSKALRCIKIPAKDVETLYERTC